MNRYRESGVLLRWYAQLTDGNGFTVKSQRHMRSDCYLVFNCIDAMPNRC